MFRMTPGALGHLLAIATVTAWLGHGVSVDAGAGGASTVRIPAGSYVPLYAVTSKDRDRRVTVGTFVIDARPVTNAEFLEFVRRHPDWRRSRIPPLFADEAYLRHWQRDLVLGEGAPATSPVVNVSWFAARAYLASVGRRLPTQHEWEYVASARPRGVHGVPGPVQEWIEDFNSVLATGESRADAALDRALFCGSGAIGATDVFDYPAFMRHAFRSSLDGRYSLANLGFRGIVARLDQPDRDHPAPRPPAEPSIYSLDIGLVDARGRQLTLADLRARPLVATMVYTSCQSVCPTIIETMKAIERRLPASHRSRVTFAMFSLDPGRDTASALSAFAAAHRLDDRTWRLFATSEADVRTLAAALGVKFRAEADDTIAHSAVILVIDGDGVVRHRQTGVATDPGAVVAALGPLAR